MVNAQEWLEQEYPKEIRNEVKHLYVHRKNLEGHLDLRDFIRLERLDCSYNQLTSLDLTGLANLEWLFCNNNYLTELDYSLLNADGLTHLNIDDNNFPKQDLSVFSKLVDLRLLCVGNFDEKRITEGNYNRFHGSLNIYKV